MPDRPRLRSAPDRRLPPFSGPSIATGVLPRRYLVMDGEISLGWSLLERRFPPRRMAAGVFHAEPIFEIYEGTFEAFRLAGADRHRLEEYVRRRDELGLTVVERPGAPIPATVEWISRWDDGQRNLHVSTEYPAFWELGP